MTCLARGSIAAVSFIVALGASLALSPSILESAFALDAAPGPDRGSLHPGLSGETADTRIAALRTALKITGAQSGLWDAVADVMRRQAREQDAMIAAARADRDGEPTAIALLEDRQNLLTREAGAAAELLAAVRPLYAVFSAEQRRVADEFFAQRIGGSRSVRSGPGGLRHGPARAD